MILMKYKFQIENLNKWFLKIKCKKILNYKKMKIPIINHNKTLKKIVHLDKLIKIMINKTIKMIYI